MMAVGFPRKRKKCGFSGCNISGAPMVLELRNKTAAKAYLYFLCIDWLFFPQINRFRCLARKGKRHFSASACGFVSRKNCLKDSTTILAGHDWLFVIQHTIDKVGHFLGKPVVPGFIVNSE